MARAQLVPFRAIHATALALCAIMLPWSTAFLSIAQMLLAANWIAAGVAHGEARARWRSALLRPEPLVFIGFLALHIVGLLWTDEMGWGLDLCRILFPVFVFGVVLGGSARLSTNELRVILLLGAWSAIASGLFGLLFSNAASTDYRGLSLFISHIRLSLLLCLATAFLLLCWPARAWQRIAHIAGAVLAIYLIMRLASIQGLFILASMAMVLLLRRWRTPVRIAVTIVLVAAATALGAAAFDVIGARSKAVPPGLASRMERTPSGHLYHHDTTSTQTENGTHVWTYIAWDELRSAWPLRSGRSLDDADDLGHPIWSTAVRYMASKGLRKDSASVMALSDADIRAIERGVPNALRDEQGMVRARIEEVLFELERYRATGKASGHSVAMRIEFLKAGWAIVQENWLFGVGTGDTQRAFDAHYAETGSTLDARWRLRAHNEFLTLLLSFGALGLAFSLFSWWWPAWRMGAWRNPLFICWAIAFGISCLTDDTIETQAGATFFAFYYALLVFARPLASDVIPAAAASRT
jgi:hypothetical protein